MSEQQERNIGFPQVWRLLASMRLGLVLMFLLAGAAALGVLLPQGTAAQADILSKLKSYLGTEQVFTTWWFKTLAVLLGINVAACVFSRFAAVFNVFRFPRMRVTVYERLKFNETFSVKGSLQEVSDAVSRTLLSARYRVLQSEDDDNEDQVMFYGDKQRVAVLGPLLAHIGALILITGIIWGSVSAYEGEVYAVPGSSFLLSKIAANNKAENLGNNDLKVQVNQTSMLSSSEGQPEYKGNISLIANNENVLNSDIGFDNPVKYQDLSIYLVKYMPAMQVNVTYQGTNIPVVLTSSSTNHTQLPGNEGYILLWNNISIRSNRTMVDFALAQGTNLIQQGHLTEGVVANPLDQLSISIEGYKGITVLRAVRDPGLGLVLTGAILLVVGMFLSLMLSYRKVWFALTSEGEQVLVNAGGFGRLKVKFGPEFTALLKDIKACQGG